MSLMTCAACHEVIIVPGSLWEMLGEETECPNCHANLKINYDESWDGENEYGWFYTEVTNVP